MKPAKFEMIRPATLDDALKCLAQYKDDAKVIAGGQSLVPMMNLRIATPGVLIDVSRIAELKSIDVAAGEIRIGALVTQAALLDDARIRDHAPLIWKALHHVGHVQTRARGTIGGSLAHADPAAELCLAATLLNAKLRARRQKSVREIAANDFFVGGLTTALEPDELLCEIVVPKADDHTRCAFREIARRHGDFAIAAVGVQLDRLADGGQRLSAAVGGVGEVPHALGPVVSKRGNLQRADIGSALAAQLDALAMNDDIHATADYRRVACKALLSDCLDEVFQ